MPPPENGWRGSSRTRRCGSSEPPRCWRGRAPGSATSTFSHRAIRCCAAAIGAARRLHRPRLRRVLDPSATRSSRASGTCPRSASTCSSARASRSACARLVGGKVNVALIDRNWADILRVASTMAAGTMRPSQLPAQARRVPAPERAGGATGRARGGELLPLAGEHSQTHVSGRRVPARC